jgi:hypothetical protein
MLTVLCRGELRPDPDHGFDIRTSWGFAQATWVPATPASRPGIVGYHGILSFFFQSQIGPVKWQVNALQTVGLLLLQPW